MQAFNTFRRTLALSTLAVGALCSGQAHAQAEPFLGQIACFGFNFAPRGWLPADGRLIPIQQNVALFALLGTSYGGDGIRTFGLPNLQGRVVMGAGQAPSGVTYFVGQTGGSEAVNLSVSNLPPHAHTVAPAGSSGDATDISPAGKAPATKARTTLYGNPTPGTNLAATSTSSVGSGTPVATLPPYVAMTCAIAVTGIFPSRD
jgi:microcystin-dependent protein